MPEKKEPPKVEKRGRKTVVEGVDLVQVEQWGYLKTSYADMAALLGIGESTVDEWMRQHGNNFRTAYKKGLARGNDEIREAQLKSAKRGDNAMLVWLGKVRLDQREAQQFKEEEEPSQLVIEVPPGANDGEK